MAFTRFDSENTGFIDKHSVCRICAEYDVPVSEETLEELMQKCVHVQPFPLAAIDGYKSFV